MYLGSGGQQRGGDSFHFCGSYRAVLIYTLRWAINADGRVWRESLSSCRPHSVAPKSYYAFPREEKRVEHVFFRDILLALAALCADVYVDGD